MAEKSALSARTEIDHPILLKGDSRTLYVLIRFAAPEVDIAPHDRPPLNLSLVLDRSGSMAEKGKIEYLRQAAKMAASRLGSRDAISVVEFDDRITILWPADRARDSHRLAGLIDGLTPRGSTNLAGGLQQGITEASAAADRLHLSRETLSRVILLSDGLANTGVTDHGAIARIAGEARKRDIRVSSIGLGLDYDEDLMQAIAESGGGKYYYVESPVQLARIFEEELQSAFTTRARDVHLDFRGGRPVRTASLVGIADGSGRNVSADWPDFYSGEERTALLRLTVDAGAGGALNLGQLHIVWRDAQSGAAGTLDIPLSVHVSSDPGLVERSVNKDTAVEAALAESERAFAGSVKLYESGKLDDAKRQNAALIRDLKAKNATWNDERVRRKIESLDVEQSQMAAPAPPAVRQNYLKATKQRLYQAKSGNRLLYVLKPGDKGIQVERLQTRLIKLGHYRGKVTGVYDVATADAVRAFQRTQQIDPDGVAGASTQAALGLY